MSTVNNICYFALHLKPLLRYQALPGFCGKMFWFFSVGKRESALPGLTVILGESAA